MITWVVIFLIFFVLCVVFLYKGGKDRRTLEKEMIAENTKKEKEMMKIK